MSDGEENRAKGSVDKLKGEIKDQYGKLTDDKKKQLSGKMDKLKGEIKNKFGKIQEKSKKNNDLKAVVGLTAAFICLI